MKNLVLPAFGENVISDIKTNETARAVIIGDVDADIFERYRKYFIDNGFFEKENRKLADNLFASFYADGVGVFMTYYVNIGELNIITEEECKYFDYTDTVREKSVTPQITQVHLEDFGLSEVVRLSDGRFIVLTAAGWLSRILTDLWKPSTVARFMKNRLLLCRFSRIRILTTSMRLWDLWISMQMML